MEVFYCLTQNVAVPTLYSACQVKNILSSRDSSGNSLLSSAVESKSVVMFEAVMVVVVDKLPEEEVSRCTLGPMYLLVADLLQFTTIPPICSTRQRRCLEKDLEVLCTLKDLTCVVKQ